MRSHFLLSLGFEEDVMTAGEKVVRHTQDETDLEEKFPDEKLELEKLVANLNDFWDQLKASVCCKPLLFSVILYENKFLSFFSRSGFISAAFIQHL